MKIHIYTTNLQYFRVLINFQGITHIYTHPKELQIVNMREQERTCFLTFYVPQ